MIHFRVLSYPSLLTIFGRKLTYAITRWICYQDICYVQALCGCCGTGSELADQTIQISLRTIRLKVSNSYILHQVHGIRLVAGFCEATAKPVEYPVELCGVMSISEDTKRCNFCPRFFFLSRFYFDIRTPLPIPIAHSVSR